MKNGQIIKRTFAFAKPFLPLFIIGLILTMIVVFMEGITLWFTGSLLDTIFSNEDIVLNEIEFSMNNLNEWLKFKTKALLSGNGERDTLGVLQVVCVLIPLLYLTKNLLSYFQRLLMAWLNLRVVENIRNVFYAHVLRLPVSFYDKNKTGDVVSYLVRDVNEVQGGLTSAINQLSIEPAKVILFFSLLLVIDVKLTLIILLIYPFFGWIIGLTGKVIKRRAGKMLASFSGVVSVINETVSGIRSVKMFNGDDYEIEKFKGENRKLTRTSFRQQMVATSVAPFSEFVSLSFTSLLLWFGGRGVVSGSSSFTSDDFLRYLLILFAAYTPIKKLTQLHTTVQIGLSAASRVFAVFDEDVEELEIDETTPRTFESTIEYSNVTFNYPGYEEDVLKDVSFKVNKGEMVAFVGSSGSGKSTILDLLPCYYPIEKGTISIDGEEISECNLKSLRSLFGTVSQETFLFDDTIAKNIAYGQDEIEYKHLQSVIEAANAKEFIDDLPKGIETVIGERGVTLSGGQRQRLAIARALYRNPEILILDEATSALDTESERLVQNAIDTLVTSRTTLVVAHRLSTVIKADRIVVLDKGRIVETGSHDELLALNGRYKELYDIQFG